MRSNSIFVIKFENTVIYKKITVFLAPPARLELTTFRLGGGPSILVRYGGKWEKYSIFRLNRKRTNCRLGGSRSIQLSYWRI